MFCTKCGSPNFDDAIVCKKCASPFAPSFTRADRKVASRSPSFKRLLAEVLGYGLLFAALIVGLLIERNKIGVTSSSTTPSTYVAPGVAPSSQRETTAQSFSGNGAKNTASTSEFTYDENGPWARRDLHNTDNEPG